MPAGKVGQFRWRLDAGQAQEIHGDETIDIITQQSKRLREVPKTLRAATDLLRKSKMLRSAFGDAVVDHYVHTAEWEQFEYDRRVTDWELKRGFERS